MPSKTYEGTPNEILDTIADEMVQALTQASIPLSPIHVLALMRVTLAAREQLKESKGKTPSFPLLLRMLTHTASGSEWTKEEAVEFEEEFSALIESEGGFRKKPGSTAPIMSPSLGIH